MSEEELRLDSNERINNYLHEILSDKYALQTICLGILKDLEKRSELSPVERCWYTELVDVICNQSLV